MKSIALIIAITGSLWTAYAEASSSSAELAACLDQLQTSGNNDMVSVVKIGRRAQAITGQSFTNAVIVHVDRFPEHSLLVLKPMNNRTLNYMKRPGSSPQVAVGGNMFFLILSDDQFATFNMDAQVIGNVKMRLDPRTPAVEFSDFKPF